MNAARDLAATGTPGPWELSKPAKIEALADDPWTVSGGYAEGRPSMMVARRGAVGRGLFVKVDDLRALLADLGGEPQSVVMPGPFESECGVRHPSDPERRCMAPAGHAGPHGDDFGPHGTWWSAVGGEPQ